MVADPDVHFNKLPTHASPSQEISAAPAPAISSAGGRLQWQRIVNQPLKLKASVDYNEACHGAIRQAAAMLAAVIP